VSGAERPTLTVLEAAARLREETDRHVSGRLQALPQAGAEVSCRAGCAACCRQLVVVSPLEAHAIAAHVAADPALEAAVLARVAEWRARVAETEGLAERLQRFEDAGGYLRGAEGGALELAYWAARLPCPFLEGDRCSIYPVRPFACREHHVVSDPTLCAEDPDAVVSADTRMETRAVASEVGAACFGLPDRLIALPEALEHAHEQTGAGDTEVPEAEVAEAIAAARRRARLALARLLLGKRSG
jgi:Fe-S-cluster containining protein